MVVVVVIIVVVVVVIVAIFSVGNQIHHTNAVPLLNFVGLVYKKNNLTSIQAL